MAVTWTKTQVYYTFHAVAGVGTLQLPVGAGADEAAADAAMSAFADVWNLTYPLSAVTKSYAGNGVSDWSYTPT